MDCDITKYFNNYSSSSDIKPDLFEKIGKFLLYPVHVIIGKDYHCKDKNNMIAEPHSIGHKVLALFVLIIASPMTIPGTLVGLVFKNLSQSHKSDREIHALMLKSLVKPVDDRTLTSSPPSVDNLTLIFSSPAIKTGPLVGDFSKSLNKEDPVKPKVDDFDPENLKKCAALAAGGKMRWTCAPGGTSYDELLAMVRKANVKEIPFIIQGAAEHEYRSGFETALGYLISEADRTRNFEKIQAALEPTSVQTSLREALKEHRQGLDVRNLKYKTNYCDHDSMKLSILIKNKDTLTLPKDIIEAAESLVLSYKEIDDKTKELPRQMYG